MAGFSFSWMAGTRRRVVLAATVGILLFFTTQAAGTRAEANPDTREVAERIKKVYLKNMGKLTPKFRAHFAIRMYRVSGDTAYVKHILPYAGILAVKIKRHLSFWDSAGYQKRMGDSILSKFPDSPKNRRRITLLKKEPEYVFFREVLEQVFQLNSLGLAEAMGPDYEQVLKHLAAVKWANLLLNPELIREYASKLANYVYYLKLLGIADLEDEYTRAFQAVFMNSEESKLGKIEYENRIYGLTHFVLAGSGYLQQYVPAEHYAWILDYFDKHKEEIMARSKPDVIAEVGLCFKLCGQKNHPVVALARQKLVEAFDPKQGFIPIKKGKAKLNKSEHRNIMAYLLLTDFEQLYPGPHINRLPELKQKIESTEGQDSD